MNNESPSARSADRLTNLEAFLKAKRNALLWSSVLFLLSISHTGAPITASALGASLAISPRLLVGVVLIAACYYQYGFWYEATWVRRVHSAFGDDANSREISERIEQERRQIDRLVDQSTRQASHVAATVKDIRGQVDTQLRYIKSVFETMLSQLSELRTANDDMMTAMDPLNVPEASQSYRRIVAAIDRIEQELLQANSADEGRVASGLESLVPNLPAINQQLTSKVEQTYTALRKYSASIHRSEQLTFQWYDVTATWLVFLAGAVAALADLVPVILDALKGLQL